VKKTMPLLVPGVKRHCKLALTKPCCWPSQRRVPLGDDAAARRLDRLLECIVVNTPSVCLLGVDLRRGLPLTQAQAGVLAEANGALEVAVLALQTVEFLALSRGQTILATAPVTAGLRQFLRPATARKLRA
jgi:hypothetical protein